MDAGRRRDKAATNSKPAQAVNLLPAFDQYVVASTRQADNLLPGPLRARVYRPQGWLSPVLLVDGRMDGVWKHERKGARLAVTIEPFVDVPPWAVKAAEDEAARLGEFLGAARSHLDLTGEGSACRPHSVLDWPDQRPARGSSPGATGRVHGQQPIDG